MGIIGSDVILNVQKAREPEEIEFEPDAWARFERAVGAVSKSPPKHRAKPAAKKKAAKRGKPVKKQASLTVDAPGVDLASRVESIPTQRRPVVKRKKKQYGLWCRACERCTDNRTEEPLAPDGRLIGRIYCTECPYVKFNSEKDRD